MERNRNGRRGIGRTTYSIVVDGETELWYLSMLRRNEKLPLVSILPELPKKKLLADQFELVKTNAKIYSHSIWIVDLDVVIAEDKAATLAAYISEVKTIKNIDILVNSPCLEFWFLMHFSTSGKYYQTCGSLGVPLKKCTAIAEYAKSEKYFVNTAPDIYRRLKPYLSSAIKQSKKLGNFDPQNPNSAKAEMYKLFEILGLA